MSIKSLIALSFSLVLIAGCGPGTTTDEDGTTGGEVERTVVCCIDCDGSDCNGCSTGDVATCTDILMDCGTRDPDCDTHNCWSDCKKPDVS